MAKDTYKTVYRESKASRMIRSLLDSKETTRILKRKLLYKPSTIWGWASGHRLPSLASAVILEREFGIPTADWFHPAGEEWEEYLGPMRGVMPKTENDGRKTRWLKK